MGTARAGRSLLTVVLVLLVLGLTPTTPLYAASGPRATGGGTFQETGQNSPEEKQTSTFAFNAITHKDGRVSGHLKYHWRAEGTTWQVDVNCLQVVGNQAVLGGTLTKVRGKPSNPTFIEGAKVIFYVEDNGQGGASSPDRVSDLFTGAPQCNVPVFFPPPPFVNFFELRGNLQVQP